MDGIVSEVVVGIALEVTMQEQQRRVKHEKGEGEVENKDTHATNAFFMTLEPCVYVTRMKMCEVCIVRVHQKKCACDR